jgi:hypothetical protein
MGKYDDFISLDLGEMTSDERQFGKRKRIDRLKIPAGEAKVIRFLRGPRDPKFYIVRKQHWGIPIGMGNTPPLPCNYSHFEEPCYFCQVVNDYYNAGDPRKQDLARRMKASASVMSNVIDVDDAHNEDGTPKVQIYQYSWRLFSDIRSYFQNPEYGDLTHPMTGRNFKISASVTSNTGDRAWTRYDVQVGASAKELVVPEALDHLYDLDVEFPAKHWSFEEQEQIFEGVLDPRTGAPQVSIGGGNTTGTKRIEGAVEEDESASDFEETDEFGTSPSPEVESKDDAEWGEVLSEDSDGGQEDVLKKLDDLKKIARGGK